MGLADLVAVLLFVGVIAYALFGGADFGCGFWDLTAGDADRGAHLRHQIDKSIGPVWEANHVWLIYILVFLWTAFPEPFAAIMNTLFVPWLIVGLGIVLRGGAFAFRKFSSSFGEARLHGVMFATSSIITPFFLGMIAGAIASGRVPADGTGELLSSWTGPVSWIGGVLAVLTTTFLAGTFLAADARRSGNEDLAHEVGRKSLVAGAVTGVVALGAAVIIEVDAPTLASGLHGRGLPIILTSAVAGSWSVWRLWSKDYAQARIGAIIAVASIVIGWGIGQYDWILVNEVTIEQGIGARSTQIGLVIVFALAAITAVPALIWLYVLVNSDRWSKDVPRSDDVTIDV